jgi:hypothetical protein
VKPNDQDREAIRTMRMKFAEVVEVRAGYPFRGRVTPDPGGNARVVQIRDLDDAGRIRTDNLVRVRAVNLDNYRFRPGDVLFLARGERRFAIPIPEHAGDLLAASYFFVLRPDKRMDADYLTWAVNDADFQDAMRAFVKGSSMPQITKADLLELPIDVPPMATQRKIVAVHELMERERLLGDELQRNRAALMRAAARRST